MDKILFLISLLVVFLGVINLVRMASFLIGSDLYTLKSHFKFRKHKLSSYPKIGIVIPAYNEQESVTKCLESVFLSDYPKDSIAVIVVNDGSTDSTAQLVQCFKNKNNFSNLTLVSQPNLGKAHALNNGMKNYTTSELVMCLDADSYLDKSALKNAVKYFEDQTVMALAANVKITSTKGLFNLIQRFEYTINHQMKKAQTHFNIEYIIGGVGSTFRKSFLEKIDFYDGNTVTEDIDLTMKILRSGNKNVRVIYGSDVISYTQSALTISDLIKQRYRWKWGRYQTFYKNKEMFFTGDSGFTKGLTWLYLPFAVFSDLVFLLEPLVIGYLLCIILVLGDLSTLFSALAVISFYFIMNTLAEDTLTVRDKLTFLFLAPVMYIPFYLLSFVEYVSLIKSVIRLPNLQKSLDGRNNRWSPIKRAVTKPIFTLPN